MSRIMNRHDYSQRRGPLSDLSPFAQLEDRSMPDDDMDTKHVRKCMSQGGFPSLELDENGVGYWRWPNLKGRAA